MKVILQHDSDPVKDWWWAWDSIKSSQNRNNKARSKWTLVLILGPRTIIEFRYAGYDAIKSTNRQQSMNLKSHGRLGPLITHHYNSRWVVIIVFDDHGAKTHVFDTYKPIRSCVTLLYHICMLLFAHCWWPSVRFHPVSILQISISPRLSSCHVLPVPFSSPWVSQQTTHEQRGVQWMSVVSLPWLWTNFPKWSRNQVWFFPIIY